MNTIFKIAFGFYFFVSTPYLFGQNQGLLSSGNEKPNIYIEGFNYPSFEKYTHYAWFRVNFSVSPTTEFSVGGEHYRNHLADRFSIPIEVRQFISEKTFLIGGYEREWDLLNNGLGTPNPVPMDEVYFGVGHNVSPNMLLEAKIVQPLGQQRFYKVGLEGVRTRVELGSRIKF